MADAPKPPKQDKPLDLLRDRPRYFEGFEWTYSSPEETQARMLEQARALREAARKEEERLAAPSKLVIGVDIAAEASSPQPATDLPRKCLSEDLVQHRKSPRRITSTLIRSWIISEGTLGS
jgi:hypothetical protein